MMQKAKKAALCAAISLLLGSVSVPLFSGYASAASVASQHKAYVEFRGGWRQRLGRLRAGGAARQPYRQ